MSNYGNYTVFTGWAVGVGVNKEHDMVMISVAGNSMLIASEQARLMAVQLIMCADKIDPQEEGEEA